MGILLTDANATVDNGNLENDLNDLLTFETNLAKVRKSHCKSQHRKFMLTAHTNNYYSDIGETISILSP